MVILEPKRPRAPITCGICGAAGHNKRRCLQNINVHEEEGQGNPQVVPQSQLTQSVPIVASVSIISNNLISQTPPFNMPEQDPSEQFVSDELTPEVTTQDHSRAEVLFDHLLGQQEINADEEEEDSFINDEDGEENLGDDMEIPLSDEEEDLGIFFFSFHKFIFLIIKY